MAHCFRTAVVTVTAVLREVDEPLSSAVTLGILCRDRDTFRLLPLMLLVVVRSCNGRAEGGVG